MPVTRCWTRPIMVACMVAWAAAYACAGVTVELLEEATVQGSHVRLGEVARITGPAAARARVQRIFLGPAPSGQGALTRERVLARLRAHGLSGEAVILCGATEVRLTSGSAAQGSGDRPAVQPAGSYHAVPQQNTVQRAVSQAAAAYALRVCRVPGAEATVEVVRLDDDFDQASRVRCASVMQAPRLLLGRRGRFGFALFDASGERLGSVEAVLRVTMRAPAVVAVRTLRRGATVRPADVRMGVAELEADCRLYTAMQAVIGKRMSETVSAGDPLTQGAVEVPPLVKRGDVVPVTARNGAFTVRQLARALDSGGANQVIPVRNPESGKNYCARVTPDGELELVMPQEVFVAGTEGR